MSNLFKPSWWISMFMSTFMTMFFIYLIKKMSTAVEIPVVSNVAKEV